MLDLIIWIPIWHRKDTLYCCSAETLLEVTALGPEEVQFEKLAAREFAALLRLAGTYVVQASLEGVLLPGEPHIQCKTNTCTAFLRVCCGLTRCLRWCI